MNTSTRLRSKRRGSGGGGNGDERITAFSIDCLTAASPLQRPSCTESTAPPGVCATLHFTFKAGPRGCRAVPVAHDALLDHRDVLVQQARVCSLITAFFLLELTSQFVFTRLLRARLFGGAALLLRFLLLAFDLGDPLAFSFGLSLPLRLGLTFPLCFLAFPHLLFFQQALLIRLFALLQFDLALLLGALFRLAPRSLFLFTSLLLGGLLTFMLDRLFAPPLALALLLAVCAAQQ